MWLILNFEITLLIFCVASYYVEIQFHFFLNYDIIYWNVSVFPPSAPASTPAKIFLFYGGPLLPHGFVYRTEWLYSYILDYKMSQMESSVRLLRSSFHYWRRQRLRMTRDRFKLITLGPVVIYGKLLLNVGTTGLNVYIGTLVFRFDRRSRKSALQKSRWVSLNFLILLIPARKSLGYCNSDFNLLAWTFFQRLS